MAKKKERVNLFSGGLLDSATTEVSQYQQEEREHPSYPSDHEEEDPLFGNAKRIQSLTQKATSVIDASTYPKIAIEKLENNPYQPRRHMNQKRLQDLAREIKDHGFKGVLLARTNPDDKQRYQLIFGHKRREASKMAGLTELPVLIDDTVSNDEMKFLAINENLLREDLTPLDEAYTYAFMCEEMSQEAVAERLGVSRGYIRNRLDILKSPLDVQDMVEEKPDTMKAVVYLKDVEEDNIRQTAIQALKNEEITINQLKAFIENLRKQATTVEERATTLTPSHVEQTILSPSDVQEVPEQNGHRLENTSREQMTPAIAYIPTVETKPVATIIQQSKEQTEAVTDRTKLDGFTKHLEKYDQRLYRRSITTDERIALETVISVARRILSNHGS